MIYLGAIFMKAIRSLSIYSCVVRRICGNSSRGVLAADANRTPTFKKIFEVCYFFRVLGFPTLPTIPGPVGKFPEE